MQNYLKTTLLILIFSLTICAQNLSRQQKAEELRKIQSKIEQLANQLDNLQTKSDELSENLLSVSDLDKEEAENLNADVVRLFPDKIFDDLMEDEQSASIYIFNDISSLFDAPRIEYKNGSLEFVKKEKTLGFIAKVSDGQFNDLNEQTPEFIALAKYQQPAELKDAKNEFVADNLSFKESVPISVGNIYLARVMRYGGNDAIFALKVHRFDEDRSIILFIKKLKSFESAKLKNIASTEQYQIQVIPLAVDAETSQKVQNAMLQKGFFDVTVDSSTTPMTLRGTVPKGKLAEVIQLAQETNGGKPVKNELTEQ